MAVSSKKIIRQSSLILDFCIQKSRLRLDWRIIFVGAYRHKSVIFFLPFHFIIFVLKSASEIRHRLCRKFGETFADNWCLNLLIFGIQHTVLLGKARAEALGKHIFCRGHCRALSCAYFGKILPKFGKFF